MSLKRIISLLALSILTAAFSAVSFGQEAKPDSPKADATRKMRHEGRGGDRFGKGMRGGHLGRRGGFGGLYGITLTDAQKEQIRSIREANKPDTALMQEARTIRQSRKSGTDLTAEQKARLAAIHDQMRLKAQAMHDQIQNVLTAEQKAELEKLKAERRQRMEQFRERRQEMRRNRELNRPKTTDGATTRPKTI